MPKPEPSTELKYLRLVMNQEWDDDDKNDVALARWRARMLDKPEWIHDKLLRAERDYRDEVAAWDQRVLMRKRKNKNKSSDLGTAKCLEVLAEVIKGFGK